MSVEQQSVSTRSWFLLYTKSHAEDWADMNLRAQGFQTLCPRTLRRGRCIPLFPRYLFVAVCSEEIPRAVRGTFGVRYVVEFAGKPACVPHDVIAEVAARMNEHGIVHLEPQTRDSLFSRRERERVRALVKFAQAGFRVRSA